MESDLTQDFEQRVGKYPRNVPSGPEESGSQKPFSRPWEDWNLQGTVNTQEEEDFKDVQGQCRSRSLIHHTVEVFSYQELVFKIFGGSIFTCSS